MSKINREVPIPFYYQLKEILREQISDGTLKPGDKLPIEDKLCTLYGISRTPVRQALAELVQEGLLIRIPARGTFVTEPEARHGASGITLLRAVVSDARWREPLDGAVELWNAAHLDDPISVDFQIVAREKLRATLIAAVGRGEAPDISVLDSVWVAEFAHQHYLSPLGEVDPDWVHLNGASYFPVMLDANKYQGELYALPITMDVSMLWYRRDWFAEEGLSPPNTWDELVAVGQHFQAPKVRERFGLGEHPFVFVGGRQGGETTTHQLLPFLWAAGGDLISDNQVVLDSIECRRALTFLRGLIHEYRLTPPEVVNYSWNQAARILAKGKAAMSLGGSYESFFIQHMAGWDEGEFEERMGFTPIPAGPNGQPAVLAGGMSYVLYRQSRKPKQAISLLDMTGRSEVLKPFCLRTGHIPPKIHAAHDLKPGEDGFVAWTIPLLEIARARPVISEYARVSGQFQVMVEECLGGLREVGEVISLASERINAITGFPIVRRKD